MRKNRYTHYLIPIGFMLLAFAIWLLLIHQFRLDDSFITYRYARNAARGWGLVYNRDDAILSTTAPLYAALLAVFSFIISDFHTLGGIIGTTCIGLGGIFVYALLPRGLRAWAGVLYVLSTPLWLSLGMETPLWIMLVLAAVWRASKLRWAFAGLLVGLAIFVRPDAALPGGLLGLVALFQTINQMNTRRRWWSTLAAYVLSAAVPVLIFAIWGMATYGSPLPATLGAKSAQAVLGITGLGPFVGTFDGLILIVQDLLAQSPLYILIGLLLLAGLSRRLPWPVVLIVIWGVLHLLTYAILRIAPYRWYYAPLLPGVILLAAFGLEKVDNWVKRFISVGATRRVAPMIAIALGFIVLLAPIMSFARINDYFVSGGDSRVMLPVVDWDVYRQVGEWLNQNIAQDATVGVAEVGQVGYYADRWMTDYLGLLQPDVAAMLKRGDLYSWLAEYAPDYLVFQRFRGVALVLYNYVIENDPWFIMAYQPITEFDDPRYSSGPVTIFQRVIPKREMIEQNAQMDYGGLRLMSLAIENFDESRTVRVRVDWNVVGDLPENLHLAVKILDMSIIPSFDADYHTPNWQGTFSTWHTLVLPEDAPPGMYPLHVAVGTTGGPYDGQNVAWFEVPGDL